MSITEPTIGATEDDQVNPNETFTRTLTFFDGDVATDLTGATLSIEESFPPSIKADAVLALTTPASGLASMTISAANMAKLSLGKKNWFRLKSVLAGGTVDVTPKIWIQVT